MSEEIGGSSENVSSPSPVVVLPAALLASILSKLDVASICSTAASCKTFNSCVVNLLNFIPDFNLSDLALTANFLRPLLPPNPHLRSLKLDCSCLDDSSISFLIRPSLHELCLIQCNQFSSHLLSKIGEKCRDLRTLSLGSLGENLRMLMFSLADLEELLSGCPQLQSLSLTFDIARFNWAGFPHIWSMASRNLIVLKMGYITAEMVTELLNMKVNSCQSPQPMLPFAPCLQKLQLLVASISDDLVTTISNVLPSLTHLDLEDPDIVEPDTTGDLTNAGIQQINIHRKLKHLSLVRGRESLSNFFRRVNDQGILLMAESCSSLESICLGGFCRLTDTGFRAILHSCSNLQKFTVCIGSQLTDLLFHDISATALSLTHIGLRRCNLLTNHAIIQLACNKNLTLLDIRHCRDVGDEALKAIGSLSKLKILLLDDSNISDMGISYLASGAAMVVSLSVRRCRKLTDTSISTIFETSFGQTLQVLDLSDLPNLSDNGILSLAKSRVPLTELHLQNCTLIGDTSVIALASMQAQGGWCGSTLRVLDLYGCGITVCAFKWLKKPYFPRLRYLGLTTYLHKDMVDALALKRPFLRILPQLQDLGDGYWDPDKFCSNGYEEVDELEQWLLDGMSGDEDMWFDDGVPENEEMIAE